MSKFIIPAALALSVMAVSGSSVIAPVSSAHAASSCKSINIKTKRLSCETRERRKATFERVRKHNYVSRTDFTLEKDPGGGGGRR